MEWLEMADNVLRTTTYVSGRNNCDSRNRNDRIREDSDNGAVTNYRRY